MTKIMWTPACPTSHSKIMGINMELVTPTPLCCYNSLHSFGKAFCMHLALCTGHCRAETGKGLPQTIATTLEAQNHLECHCIKISLLRGLARTMKN